MWESILTEWASLILRWLHVVAAIGWIGSSFYFIHLDLSLKPRSDLPEGVNGVASQVHGGGSYRLMAYPVAPATPPDPPPWSAGVAPTATPTSSPPIALVSHPASERVLVATS